jgi:putative DNA-invertase from lambdoid prophage Rac
MVINLVRCLDDYFVPHQLREPIMSRTFLYSRSWPDEPDADPDLRAANSVGYELEPRRIVAERIKVSVAATNRPLFTRLLDRLEPSDTLLVCSLDRLGCASGDALGTVHLLRDLGVHLVVLELPDLTDKTGSQTLAAVARLDNAVQMERHPTRVSTAPSRVGRKSSLTDEQKSQVRVFAASGMSARQVAKLFKVSHPTVLRILSEDMVQN